MFLCLFKVAFKLQLKIECFYLKMFVFVFSEICISGSTQNENSHLGLEIKKKREHSLQKANKKSSLRKYLKENCSNTQPPTLLDTHTRWDTEITNLCLRLCFLYRTLISLLRNPSVCLCVHVRTKRLTYTKNPNHIYNIVLNMSSSKWGYLTNQKRLFSCSLL